MKLTFFNNDVAQYIPIDYAHPGDTIWRSSGDGRPSAPKDGIPLTNVSHESDGLLIEYRDAHGKHYTYLDDKYTKVNKYTYMKTSSDMCHTWIFTTSLEDYLEFCKKYDIKP